MTHPFHPLRGRTLEVVDCRRGQDGEYVYVEVDSRRVERLPSAWTSLGCVDPVVRLAAGRSLFRADDLTRLAEIVASIGCVEPGPSDGGGKGHV